MNLKALFSKFNSLRVGVLGDVCLDIYWWADMRLSELSRETPHHPLPVVDERITLGAAGNVAACAAALRPESLTVLGLCGNDWRGQLMQQQLLRLGADTNHFIEVEGHCTSAYVKPMRSGISDVVYEDPRIDFEPRKAISQSIEKRLQAALMAAEKELDVLLVSDQLVYGCVTPSLRQAINNLGKSGRLILVDSRARVEQFRHVLVTPNHVEALRATKEADVTQAALRLSSLTEHSVVVTMSAEGALLARDGRCTQVPGRPVPPPVDPVGAGDAFLAALGMSLGAGLQLEDAAAFAGAAAAVTVRKIGTTGTATPEEIAAIW